MGPEVERLGAHPASPRGVVISKQKSHKHIRKSDSEDAEFQRWRRGYRIININSGCEGKLFFFSPIHRLTIVIGLFRRFLVYKFRKDEWGAWGIMERAKRAEVNLRSRDVSYTTTRRLSVCMPCRLFGFLKSQSSPSGRLITRSSWPQKARGCNDRVSMCHNMTSVKCERFLLL